MYVKSPFLIKYSIGVDSILYAMRIDIGNPEDRRCIIIWVYQKYYLELRTLFNFVRNLYYRVQINLYSLFTLTYSLYVPNS